MRALQICALLLISGLGLSSCSSDVSDPGPGKRVTLEISKEIYQSGDTVMVDVINSSDLDLTYPGDFCPQGLQRLGEGTWVDVSPPDTTHGCPLSTGVLGARARQTIAFHLPEDLSTDVYRIVLPAPTVDINDPNLAEPPLHTPEFTVSSRTQ
jgi:hypothetical protein